MSSGFLLDQNFMRPVIAYHDDGHGCQPDVDHQILVVRGLRSDLLNIFRSINLSININDLLISRKCSVLFTVFAKMSLEIQHQMTPNSPKTGQVVPGRFATKMYA